MIKREYFENFFYILLKFCPTLAISSGIVGAFTNIKTHMHKQLNPDQLTKGRTMFTMLREPVAQSEEIIFFSGSPNFFYIFSDRRWRPDLDCLDTDPDGLYGLRPEFLKVLGIKPPLNKMVHVNNVSN